MEECSVQVPATRAGTESDTTFNDTSATVPHPKGKGKERQDVNNVDESSGPTDDDECGEDAFAKQDVPSDRACSRIKKREKQAEAYQRYVASIHLFLLDTDFSIL